MEEAFSLNIAVRAHTVVTENKKQRRTKKRSREGWEKDWPYHILLLDTETTTDTSQRLRFGVFRVYTVQPEIKGPILTHEGLFYAPDLNERDLETLQSYIIARREGDLEGLPKGQLSAMPLEGLPKGQLSAMPLERFLKDIFATALKKGFLIVGFNLPYDISRIACGWDIARGKQDGRLVAGGFSFYFKEYTDKNGKVHPDKFTPRICIRNLNSKASFIQPTTPWRHDPKYRELPPRFLDLRTLAYALTGRGHTLESAAVEFACTHHKAVTEGHGGPITPAYLDYARNDVLVTWELYEKLIDEYRQHPIPTPPDQAYSTASVGKGYLKAMGIRKPRLVPRAIDDTSDQILGYAMSAYYGGRAECHIRKLPVPVIYCDFTSMYPTVCTLMGLWQMIISDHITVQDATEDIRTLLNSDVDVLRELLYQPETWKRLTALVQITTDGKDRLPVRANYKGPDNPFNIGLNYLKCPKPLWYALPDLIASKLVSGNTPEVLRALRFIPGPPQSDLQETSIRNHSAIKPYTDDLFKRLIEERKRLKNNTNLSRIERDRHDLALKVIANATSYGIWAELNRDDDDPDAEERSVTVFDAQPGPFTFRTARPEEPGAYYCPPIATLITSAARLMLALAQHEVERRNGTYAFMDTDSIAIVAQDDGGTLEYHDAHRRARSITILSKADAMDIVHRFEALNPYDKSVIPDSILKIEYEHGKLPPLPSIQPISLPPREGKPPTNYLAWNIQGGHIAHLPEQDAEKIDLKRAALFAYAVAAKRYALILETEDFAILTKKTELVLGNFLDPGPEPENQQWIESFWLTVFAAARYKTPLAWPACWEKRPALLRFSLTTPTMMAWVKPFNKGKDNNSSIKPFNFMVHALPHPFDNERRPDSHLIAPYTQPEHARHTRFVDLKNGASGSPVLIDTWGEDDAGGVIVKSYADIAAENLRSTEPKYIGPGDDRPGDPRAIGELRPITVVANRIDTIGKETSIREDVETLLVPPREHVTVYQRDDWEKLKPLLQTIPVKTVAASCQLEHTHIRRLRNGTRPSPETRDVLIPYLLNLLRESSPDVTMLSDRELLDWPGFDMLVERFPPSPSDNLAQAQS